MSATRPFYSVFPSLSALVVGTACTDYNCHDTATCAPQSDAGARPFVTSDDTNQSESRAPVDSTSPSSEEPPAESTGQTTSSSSEPPDPTNATEASSSTSTTETSASTTDATSSGGDGETSAPPLASLGAGCNSDSECVSGACADGVCCEADCSSPCQSCAADGSCSVTPETDSECEPISCPTSNACATYPITNGAPECLAFGECATAEEYCVPAFAEATTSCGSGLECDGAGTCESVCGTDEVWCGDACVGRGSCRTWRDPYSLVEVSRAIYLARTAVTETGNAAVAWIEYSGDGSVSKDLWVRFYDAEADTWSSAQLVHTTATSLANVTVAPSGSEGFVFLWDESIDASVTSRHWNGTQWGNLVTLASKSSNAVREYPSNGRSLVLAVWSEFDVTYTLRASLWNGQTGGWGTTQTVHTSSKYYGIVTPALSADGTGFIVWQQAPAVTPADWELWGARLAQPTGSWSPPSQFGAALDRQSGFGLGVTASGDLVGYLAGRVKGVIWDSSAAGWLATDSSGEWINLDLCSLETNNILVAESTRLERWNRMSGRIGPTLEIESDVSRQASSSVSCVNKAALVTSVEGQSTRYDRWDEVSETWFPPHLSSEGRVLAQSIGVDGTAIVVRSADFETRDLGIEVDLQR